MKFYPKYFLLGMLIGVVIMVTYGLASGKMKITFYK